MMTRRRAFLSGAAATLAATLAGCGNNELPSTPVSSGTPSAQPVLDSARLETILKRIQGGLDAADAEKSPDLLVGYLSGPAARMREHEYTVASATADNTYIHTFTTTSKAGTVGSTTGFPRTAMTVTEIAKGDTAEYLLTLTQDSARDDFQLWAWVRLLGGAVVPATAAATVGSEQIGADSTGLVSTPQEVLDAYVDALNNPEGANGVAFADDTLRQRLASDRAVDLGGMGSVSVTATAGTDGFKGLRTSDGGALVVTTLSWDQVFTNTTAGSSISLDGTMLGSLMGENRSVVGTVTATYEVTVAFFIPPAGAKTGAVMLGMDIVPAAVARDDSKAPAAAS